MIGDDQVPQNHQTKQATPSKLNDLTEDPFEEDKTITRGLMTLSEKSLARVYENEPDDPSRRSRKIYHLYDNYVNMERYLFD